jgi:hypothetical protein
MVMDNSRILLPITTGQRTARNVDVHHNFSGVPARVRVQDVLKGPRKNTIFLYYGKVRDLCWDPDRLQWPDRVKFMSYSTKLGRKILRMKHPPLQLATKKWSQTLPADFRFRWNSIWDHERQKKEAFLMWQMWHKAVAVNIWHGKISRNIDTSCSVCGSGQEETVLHRFWDCDSSQQVWYSVTCLLNHLATPNLAIDWSLPDWKQTIFAKRPPRKFRKVNRFWILLKGIALWMIWLVRNDVSFNNTRWNQDKTKQVIWQGLSDYGRSAWCKTQDCIRRNPECAELVLNRFDAQWQRPAICSRINLSIQWVRNWTARIG